MVMTTISWGFFNNKNKYNIMKQLFSEVDPGFIC